MLTWQIQIDEVSMVNTGKILDELSLILAPGRNMWYGQQCYQRPAKDGCHG